ncbi:MAG: hypothetical protein RI571_15920, partial [Roseovarius sp.]|nr:hypothetical protein [Roseovarius sp.]
MTPLLALHRTLLSWLESLSACPLKRGRITVPRHDLGVVQVAACESLGLRAMLWKGRTAPDPTPENPEQLMCLDPEATFDALEIEHPVEQSCCKVKRGEEVHLCEQFHACGYQRQKPQAQAAQV